MAVKVKEKNIKLQTIFTDESSGTMKRRTVTLANINPEASLDNLYKLAEDLNPVVEGDFSGVNKITGEVLTPLG